MLQVDLDALGRVELANTLMQPVGPQDCVLLPQLHRKPNENHTERELGCKELVAQEAAPWLSVPQDNNTNPTASES